MLDGDNTSEKYFPLFVMSLRCCFCFSSPFLSLTLVTASYIINLHKLGIDGIRAHQSGGSGVPLLEQIRYLLFVLILP